MPTCEGNASKVHREILVRCLSLHHLKYHLKCPISQNVAYMSQHVIYYIMLHVLLSIIQVHMNNDDTDDEDDHEYDDGDDDKDLQPRELILKVSLDVRYIFLLSKSSLGHFTKHDNITGWWILYFSFYFDFSRHCMPCKVCQTLKALAVHTPAKTWG